MISYDNKTNPATDPSNNLLFEYMLLTPETTTNTTENSPENTPENSPSHHTARIALPQGRTRSKVSVLLYVVSASSSNIGRISIELTSSYYK